MSNQLKVDFVDGSSQVVTIEGDVVDSFIAGYGGCLLSHNDGFINMDKVKFLKKWSDEKQAEYVKNLVGGMYGYYAPVEEM